MTIQSDAISYELFTKVLRAAKPAANYRVNVGGGGEFNVYGEHKHQLDWNVGKGKVGSVRYARWEVPGVVAPAGGPRFQWKLFMEPLCGKHSADGGIGFSMTCTGSDANSTRHTAFAVSVPALHSGEGRTLLVSSNRAVVTKCVSLIDDMHAHEGVAWVPDEVFASLC